MFITPTRSPIAKASSWSCVTTSAVVREAFQHAWSNYVRHAWGHDQLLPLSRGYRDWYGASLQMTPLDGFDTMILMGLTEEAAREAIEAQAESSAGRPT